MNNLHGHSLPPHVTRQKRASKNHHTYSYHTLRARADAYLHSFLPRTLRAWNNLPLEIVLAPSGPFAHCKNIRSSFLPLLDHSAGKSMNLELTCTETIQTFHRPSRLHNGYPVKIEQMKLSKSRECVNSIIFDPINQH